MGRLLALALAAVLAVAAAAAVLVWLGERRRHNVFPSSQAQMLLNPLRRRLMPVAGTLERFGIGPGQTVLELGPGPGYYSLEASSLVGAAGRLLCLDLQRGMLDILSSRLSEAGASADLIVADATRVPLASSSVDRAFLVTVLGEVPDQDAALAELRRVLKPGGLLGFAESLGDPDIVFLGKLRGICRRHGFEEVSRHGSPLAYTAVFRAPENRPREKSRARLPTGGEPAR
jgi:ubiquinone/menaquinone biosynthesis C-methylase UbiE